MQIKGHAIWMVGALSPTLLDCCAYNDGQHRMRLPNEHRAHSTFSLWHLAEYMFCHRMRLAHSVTFVMTGWVYMLICVTHTIYIYTNRRAAAYIDFQHGRHSIRLAKLIAYILYTGPAYVFGPPNIYVQFNQVDCIFVPYLPWLSACLSHYFYKSNRVYMMVVMCFRR